MGPVRHPQAPEWKFSQDLEFQYLACKERDFSYTYIFQNKERRNEYRILMVSLGICGMNDYVFTGNTMQQLSEFFEICTNQMLQALYNAHVQECEFLKQGKDKCQAIH